MKSIYRITSITIAAIFILVYSSCKKDDPAPANNNTPNNSTCNFTTNVLVINATSKNILNDSCRVFGNNFFSEHWVDTGMTEGIVIIFNGTTPPATGVYTAVNTFPAVDATHAYVEYYTSASAYQPATGTITVSDNGTSKIYTFCNFSCSDGTSTKTISVRATCN